MRLVPVVFVLALLALAGCGGDTGSAVVHAVSQGAADSAAARKLIGAHVHDVSPRRVEQAATDVGAVVRDAHTHEAACLTIGSIKQLGGLRRVTSAQIHALAEHRFHSERAAARFATQVSRLGRLDAMVARSCGLRLP